MGSAWASPRQYSHRSLRADLHQTTVVGPQEGRQISQSRIADETGLAGDTQSGTSIDALQSELLDLYTAQIADLKRVEAILRQRLQLKDDLIGDQSARIQGLLGQLATEMRLGDARVDREKALCPRCPPKWQRRTLNGVSLGLGMLAGRGSCDFGD